MTTTPPPRPLAASPEVEALLDQVPPHLAARGARLLMEHTGHGGLRVQLPDTWCGCGTNLGPALMVKAGERLLHDEIDEVLRRRG